MLKVDDKVLKIISNETKNSINDLAVVTPSIYASLFLKYASEHNQTIENEKELSHDLLAQECSTLTELQNQTSKNVLKLDQNTTKAIKAIENNDTEILQGILKETDELRQ